MYVLVVGLMIIIRADVYFNKHEKTIFRDGMLLLIVLSVIDLIEHITAQQDEPSKLRRIMIAMNYSLRPAIAIGFIYLLNLKVKKRILIPAVINAGFCIASIYNGCVFSLDSENNFHSETLGWLPPTIGLLYLVMLLLLNIRILRLTVFWERFMLIFLVIVGTGALALGGALSAPEVYNPSFAAVIVLYYLFCYSQVTRRDALTKLYNRQTFFSDTHTLRAEISGLVSIDMNELKWINDNNGHAEGDEAIKSVSRCFLNCISYDDRVYRLGGDEFVVLCLDKGEIDIKLLVNRIRNELYKTDYSCAMGVAIACEGKTIDDMLAEADRLMYENKQEMKRRILEAGGELHLRDGDTM